MLRRVDEPVARKDRVGAHTTDLWFGVSWAAHGCEAGQQCQERDGACHADMAFFGWWVDSEGTAMFIKACKTMAPNECRVMGPNGHTLRFLVIGTTKCQIFAGGRGH